jgi:hypothetical protein
LGKVGKSRGKNDEGTAFFLVAGRLKKILEQAQKKSSVSLEKWQTLSLK